MLFSNRCCCIRGSLFCLVSPLCDHSFFSSALNLSSFFPNPMACIDYQHIFVHFTSQWNCLVLVLWSQIFIAPEPEFSLPALKNERNPAMLSKVPTPVLSHLGAAGSQPGDFFATHSLSKECLAMVKTYIVISA